MEGQPKNRSASNTNTNAESQRSSPATSQSHSKDGKVTEASPAIQTPATIRSSATNGMTAETSPAEHAPQTSPRPPKFESLLRTKGETVVVKVGSGKDEYPFHVHKSLLCTSSEFFRHAFSGRFSESAQGVASLPKENPEVFALYVNFLYANTVLPKGHDASFAAGGTGFPLLIKAWTLGDYLQDVNFKDATTDLINLKSKTPITGTRHFLGAVCASLIYKSTPPGSALRKLVVDQYTWYGRPALFSGLKSSNYTPEFLFDLTMALVEVRKLPEQSKAPDMQQSSCRYHEHELGNCYKTVN